MPAVVQSESSTPQVFKVLALDGIAEEGLAPLRNQSNVELTVISGVHSEEKVCELVQDKHALLVRSATKVTEAILQAGKQLLVVGRAGVGVDNIDIPAATKAGVFVVNSPMGNVVAAAEHTIAMIFTGMRCIPEAHHSLAREKKWNRSKFVGSEVKGRTLGVLGCGQVGSRVVRVMKSAGMNVVVYDPYMNQQRADVLQVEKLETLEEVFQRSDIVTLHLPKTPETVGLVDKRLMSMMKPGSVVINVARGGILNEDDCVELLKSGHLRCAAIDVFPKEPVEETNPFLVAADELGPRLVMTPHLGASTEEAQLQVAVQVSEQCIEVFSGKVPSWAVNKCRSIQTIQGYELDEVTLLTDACEYVGSMLQQLVSCPVDKLHVTVEGDDFLKMTTPETLATYTAVGFLKSKAEHGRVNIVNVEQLCEFSCLELSSKGVPHQRHTELRVSCAGGSLAHPIEIAATISNRLPDDIIIRGFCGVPCHMKLSMKHTGRLVYSLHYDVPGVVAGITQSLASRHINIADMHLARLSPADFKLLRTPSFSAITKNIEQRDIALALVLLDDAQENNLDDISEHMRLQFDGQVIDLGSIKLLP